MANVCTAPCSHHPCRGPLNKRNVIPLKFIFSEPDKYGPLVEDDEDTGKGACRGAGLPLAMVNAGGTNS